MSLTSPKVRVVFGTGLRVVVALTLAVLTACGPSDHAQVEASKTAKLKAGDVAGALAVVKAHVQAQPQSGKARLLLGSLLLSTGDAVGAEVELRRALELGAPEAPATTELGRAWLAQNKVREAVARLPEVKAANPQEAGDLAEVLALALLRAGEQEHAQQVLTAAIERAPSHLNCLLLSARLSRTTEDDAQSLSRAQALARQFEDRAPAVMLLAEAQAAIGDAQAATASYERVLQLDAAHAPAHTALVSAALGSNDLPAARRHVQRMVKALPGQAHSVYAQALLAYFSGDYAAARELQQQLLRNGSAYAPLLVMAGMTERKLGGLVKAEVLLGQAMTLLPDAIEPRRELAALHVDKGDGDRALALLEPVLDKRLSDSTTWAVAGRAYTLAGNFKAADAAFVRARALKPGDARVQLQYAQSLLRRGQDARGLLELGKASAADKGSESDLALVVALMQRQDAAGALKAIEKLAEKAPNEPWVPALRGKVYGQLGQVAAARQSYEQSLALKPDFLPAIDSLAALDLAAHQPQAAKQRYESFIKRNPRSGQAMISLAEVNRLTTGRASAVPWLDKAVAINPLDPGPWLAAVDMEQRMGEDARALSRAQQAAAALPDDYDIQRQLAALLQASGESRQALAVLQRLQGLRPNAAEPRLLLAQAHLQAKNLAAARKEIDRARALEPASAEAFRAQVVMLLSEKKNEQALAMTKAQQKLAPKDPNAWLLEAEIHAASQDWSAVVNTLRQGLAKAPDSRLAARQSDAMRRGGLSSEAAQFEEAWANAHPDDAEFVGSLGQAAEQRGDAVEAERWYRQTLKLRADAPVVLNNLALLLLKSKPNEGLQLAQRAVQLAPEVAPFLDTLAQAQAAVGQREQALKTQNKAVSLAPRSGELRLVLARLLLVNGEKAKARKELAWLSDLGDRFAHQAEVKRLLLEADR